MDDNFPIVTHEHLLGFGGIIHNYAFVESGIKIATAHVAGLDLIDFLIMSEPYNSLQLKNVAKSLAKTNEPLSPECEKFIQIIGDFAPFSKIRNFIAHARWTRGERSNSVKPSGLNIRDGRAKVLGSAEGEQDWTPQDLKDIADKLLILSQRISVFLTETGAHESMIVNGRH
jgi:hypothetical protein